MGAFSALSGTAAATSASYQAELSSSAAANTVVGIKLTSPSNNQAPSHVNNKYFEVSRT